MKLYQLLAITILMLLSSCSNTIEHKTVIKNDTIRVIELGIRTAFDQYKLPSISALQLNKTYKDSILFTADSSLLLLLPNRVDSLCFKVLSKPAICSLFLNESNLTRIPNHLYLDTFEKSDTGYYMSLESTNCLPFYGGGKIAIYIKKDQDSFIVQETHSSSIN